MKKYQVICFLCNIFTFFLLTAETKNEMTSVHTFLRKW